MILPFGFYLILEVTLNDTHGFIERLIVKGIRLLYVQGNNDEIPKLYVTASNLKFTKLIGMET